MPRARHNIAPASPFKPGAVVRIIADGKIGKIDLITDHELRPIRVTWLVAHCCYCSGMFGADEVEIVEAEGMR